MYKYVSRRADTKTIYIYIYTRENKIRKETQMYMEKERRNKENDSTSPQGLPYIQRNGLSSSLAQEKRCELKDVQGM